MIVRFYDQNLNAFAEVDYINLQWIERYFTVGEFSLQVPVTALSKGVPSYVIAIPDESNGLVGQNDRVGLVQKIEYTDDSQGKIALLSGYFAEYLLNDRIDYPTEPVHGEAEGCFRYYWNKHRRNHIIELAQANNPLLGSVVWMDIKGQNLGTALTQVLASQGLGVKVYKQGSRLLAKVYQGSQDPLMLSEEDFNRATYVKDSSAYHNYFITLGEVEETVGSVVKQTELWLEYDATFGEPRKELLVDKTSTRYTQERWASVADYTDFLWNCADEEAQKNQIIYNCDIELSQAYVYGRDYNIGDIVYIYASHLSMLLVKRITQVSRVFKAGNRETRVEIGELLPRT